MTQNPTYDVCAVGNAIVDVLAPCDPAFLTAQGLTAGSMQLVDAQQSAALYAAMAAGVEASGGSAGNTVAGVGSFGGRAAYIGKVADDMLGGVFTHDIRAAGVAFDTAPLKDGAVSGLATGVCMINVTPDGQRTMCTFLGAANQLSAADIDAGLIGASAIVYLEGYLFDPAPARAAFEAAAACAHAAGRKVAITLSDTISTPPPPGLHPWLTWPPSPAARPDRWSYAAMNASRSPSSRSTRWSTPPAPATSTPPDSFWASPAACRSRTPASSARWRRRKSSPTGARGR